MEPTAGDLASQSYNFGFKKIVCVNCADSVVSVDHPWFVFSLVPYSFPRPKFSDSYLIFLTQGPRLSLHSPPQEYERRKRSKTSIWGSWSHRPGSWYLLFYFRPCLISFLILFSFLGRDILGVGRIHRATCKKCKRGILGARYTRPYHFIPSRAHANPVYDLCFRCWHGLSEDELELDPYWIMIPSLIPNDDFEVLFFSKNILNLLILNTDNVLGRRRCFGREARSSSRRLGLHCKWKRRLGL
jgi:hypothetical protein